jgi:fluoroquinolone transport system permease protein
MNLSMLSYDIKLVRRDPMLWLVSLSPMLFFLLLKFGYPLANDFAIEQWGFALQPYYQHSLVFLLVLVPMMLGMVYGFILLDEKDAGIISVLSVTPLGKKGYLMTRMSFPVGFSFVVTTIMYFLLSSPAYLSPWQIWALQAVLAMNAPFLLLLLGAFASNKVEGMALSKGFGLILAGLLIDYFAPAPYDWLAAYSPAFWIGRAFFAATFSQYFLYLGASVLYYTFLVTWMGKVFMRKV